MRAVRDTLCIVGAFIAAMSIFCLMSIYSVLKAEDYV